jgi:hypothetical protein
MKKREVNPFQALEFWEEIIPKFTRKDYEQFARAYDEVWQKGQLRYENGKVVRTKIKRYRPNNGYSCDI